MLFFCTFLPIKCGFYKLFQRNYPSVFPCVYNHFAKNITRFDYPPCLILRKCAFEGAPVFVGGWCGDLITPTRPKICNHRSDYYPHSTSYYHDTVYTVAASYSHPKRESGHHDVV